MTHPNGAYHTILQIVTKRDIMVNMKLWLNKCTLNIHQLVEKLDRRERSRNSYNTMF